VESPFSSIFFLSSLGDAGLNVGQRAFYNWMTRVKSDSPAISANKKSGRESTFDESEQPVLFGCFEWLAVNYRELSLKVLIEKAMTLFGKTLSRSTCPRLTLGGGYTYQHTGANPKKLNVEESGDMV
jgi:hypothetical protein